MANLLSILKPFKQESKDVQANKHPTLPLCLPSLAFLKDLCEPLVDDDDEMTFLKETLLNELTTKSKIRMEHKIATFLWPQFRHFGRNTGSDLLSAEEVSEVRDVRIRFPQSPLLNYIDLKPEVLSFIGPCGGAGNVSSGRHRATACC